MSIHQFSTAALLCFVSVLIYAEVPADNFAPTKCEACAIVANELNAVFMPKKARSSADFLDALENFCANMNQYKIHKEKRGVERFSKQPSKTMETLKEMRERGVKVELGMPFEMWDLPPAEITALKQGCEQLLETHEDELEEWFVRGSKEDAKMFLCKNRALVREDSSCLDDGSGKVEL